MSKFDIFTYQISPLSNYQMGLFDEDITIDQLISRKNKIFESIFDNSLSFFSSRNKLKYKIEHISNEFILLRLANKRTLKIEIDFQSEYKEIEPSCLIAIYNDPEVQLIAIESDKTSFGNSFSVLKILEKAIDRRLTNYNLRFYPQPKYEEKVLWDLLKKYEGRIEKLQFEFSKPNLARVNRSISEDLKEASKILNSATTKVEFEAPKNQALENLNEENQFLSGMVKSSSDGAGPAKIKLTGLRSWESTESTVKSFSIDSLEIEADQKTISTFVKAIKDKLTGE
ncbi:hypothetical protein [Sphingobacterium suaedae]|uniref:DUF4747 family protein n=1 Tax=Sphingobacterium suaedae TaxID=1686402 RepID=A0ABW5KIF0_9SPHI